MTESLKVEEGTATTTFSVSDTLPFTFTPTKYRCAKHGIVTSCVSLWSGGGHEGDYCMECYKEWIRANILPVVRDDAAHGEGEKK